MSESSCEVGVFGIPNEDVRAALGALLPDAERSAGAFVVSIPGSDRSMVVHVSAPRTGDIVRLLIQEWEPELLDLRALSRDLSCAMSCSRHFNRGIDFSATWFLHCGEVLYSEGETPDGDFYLTCPSLDLELREVPARALTAPRARVRAALIERLGAPAAALLKGARSRR